MADDIRQICGCIKEKSILFLKYPSIPYPHRLGTVDVSTKWHVAGCRAWLWLVFYSPYLECILYDTALEIITVAVIETRYCLCSRLFKLSCLSSSAPHWHIVGANVNTLVFILSKWTHKVTTKFFPEMKSFNRISNVSERFLSVKICEYLKAVFAHMEIHILQSCVCRFSFQPSSAADFTD